MNGPSGKGVDDLYTPEINSNVAGAPVTNGVDLNASLALCNPATNSLPTVSVYTDCGPTQEAYDDVKVQAIVNQIHGDRSDGSEGKGVPAIFGMNFQAVSVAQKLPVGGYKDAAGTPSDLRIVRERRGPKSILCPRRRKRRHAPIEFRLVDCAPARSPHATPIAMAR